MANPVSFNPKGNPMSVTPALVRVTDLDGNVFAGLVVQDPPTLPDNAPEGAVGMTVVAIFGADASHATVSVVPAGTDPLPEAASGTFVTDFSAPAPTGPVTVRSVRADIVNSGV